MKPLVKLVTLTHTHSSEHRCLKFCVRIFFCYLYFQHTKSHAANFDNFWPLFLFPYYRFAFSMHSSENIYIFMVNRYKWLWYGLNLEFVVLIAVTRVSYGGTKIRLELQFNVVWYCTSNEPFLASSDFIFLFSQNP